MISTVVNATWLYLAYLNVLMTLSVISDEAIFTQFCEENLTVKPSLAKAGCRRLGRVKLNFD